jgi:hypothetical protein
LTELLDARRERVQLRDLMMTDAARGRAVGCRGMQTVERVAADRPVAPVARMVAATKGAAAACDRIPRFETAMLTPKMGRTTSRRHTERLAATDPLS